MNYNIIAYCIYGIITVFITVFVGKQFHNNGYYYIISIFEAEKISNAINNLLLIGYYLVNIGFAIYKISDWQKLYNIKDLIENLSSNIAFIVILLAILNFVNIAVLSIFRKQSINHYKSSNYGK